MDEQALNELLECSVCLEPLDASSKVLPCQHTFCRRCLEEIVSTKEELRCPECRTVVLVKVEDLPPNILLIRLLEGMKTASVKTSSDGGSGEMVRSAQQEQVPGTSGSGNSQSRSSPVHKPGVSIHQPCARALYDYEGTEAGDLSFKKGDIVTLRKQVDENWYHGELNGQHGFFPAVYVQIINPLPQEIPKCKALYDFYIEDENEKDCLAFTKDSVLTVIRRIDDNWIEGRLGEKIGIFPIAFVELNDAAKYLVNNQQSHSKSSSPAVGSPSATQAGNTFSLPSVCTTVINNVSPPSTLSASGSEVTVTSSTVTSSSGGSTPRTTAAPASQHGVTLVQSGAMTQGGAPVQIVTPALGVATPGLATSVTGMATNRGRCMSPVQGAVPATVATSVMHPMQNINYTVTPGGVLSVRAMQHSATTSVSSAVRPLQHPLVASVQASQRSPQKRHSLTALTPQTSSLSEAHQRRSLEVTTLSYSTANSSVIASLASVTPSVQLTTVTTAPSSVSQGLGMNMPASTNSPPSCTPIPIYHALYNYKPQKDDELELHKGDFYTVSEKCQDGWFKGRCLRTGNMGVFPGNYVQVVKASIPRHSNVRSHNQHRVHNQQPSQHHVSKQLNIPVTAVDSNSVAVNGNSPALDYQVRPGMAARLAASQNRSHIAEGAPPSGESGQAELSPRMAPVGAASHSVTKPTPHRHRMLPQSQVINSQNMVVVDGPLVDSNSHGNAKFVSGNSNTGHLVPGSRQEKSSSSAKAEKTQCNKHEKMSGSSKAERMAAKSDKRAAAHVPALPLRNLPCDGAAVPEGGNASVKASSTSSPSPSTIPSHQGVPGLMIKTDCAVTPSRSRSPHGQRVHRSASSGRTKQHLHGQQNMDNERARSAAASHLTAQHHSVIANVSVVPPNALAVNAGDNKPAIPVFPVTAAAVSGKERDKRERKDKEKISLMKRLTKSKKSRSSPPLVEAESPEIDTSHHRTGSLPNDSLEGASAVSLPVPLPTGGVPLHKKSGSLDSPSAPSQKAAKVKPLMRERYRCIVPFPPNTDAELELKVGDIVYVYKKREDGWFKGTLQRTGKSGLFPGSFVESF